MQTHQYGKPIGIAAIRWDTDDAACGKFCEKVLAETTADISEAQRRARICMESNYKDCTRAWMVKAGPKAPYYNSLIYLLFNI